MIKRLAGCKDAITRKAKTQIEANLIFRPRNAIFPESEVCNSKAKNADSNAKIGIQLMK